MKTRWIVFLLLVLTVLSGIAVLVARQQERQSLVYDDEQKGLNKQIVIYFSHVVAENTPKGLAAQKFAKLVEEKTNGRVKVEVFPNGSLYSDEEEIDALLRGDVQIIAPSVSKVTHLIPEWQVLDLPFIFETYQDVEKVFTGETGKQLLAMLDRKGIKGLALWGNGFKQMMSNRRLLVERGDFSGLKFRVMPSEVIEKQFQLLGATPVVVPFNHVYKALEKHEFDGQENTISNIYSKGFYQFQPYLTISNHGYLGYAVMINQTFWNGLPKEIQESIMEAVKETTDWNLTQSKAQNEAELALMMQHERTHIYELTEKEREKWKEMFSSLYAQFRKEFGSKLLKQIEHEKGKAE